MSKSHAALFPDGAVVAVLREPGDAALLLPAEAKCLGAALPGRASEFAGGRECARRALAEFGIHGVPIPAAPDRRPLWPEGFTGSITHTRGFAAAVVAELRRCAGVGIDTEVAADVKPDLWPTICGPEELLWLQSLPRGERPGAAAFVFSAKEAYYKCRYPLTGDRLVFHDLRIEASGWRARTGEFAVRVRRDEGSSHRLGIPTTQIPTTGRYLFHDGFVSTGVAWLAAAGDDQ